MKSSLRHLDRQIKQIRDQIKEDVLGASREDSVQRDGQLYASDVFRSKKRTIFTPRSHQKEEPNCGGQLDYFMEMIKQDTAHLQNLKSNEESIVGEEMSKGT